jgi:hypothetical protein
MSLRHEEKTQGEERDPVKMEAEMGGMQPQVKECLASLAVGRVKE